MATAPFSRYNPLTHPNAKGAFKIPKGSVLKYVPGQGYTTALAKPAVAPKVAAPPVAPPVAPQAFDFGKALTGEGIFQQDAANLNADNISAQTQRDNAAKALQFQFNDPTNPYNDLAEAGRDRSRTEAMLAANRAARGVSTSGGTTLARMDIGHDFGKQLYGLNNDFNSRMGTLDATLADTLRQNALKYQGALGDATGRLISNGVGLGSGAPGAPSMQDAAPGGGGVLQPGQPAPPGWAGGGPDAAGIAKNPQFVSKEAQTQADWNAKGYQTYFLGTPEATIRKGAPGAYTWEQHLQDLHRTGRDVIGWDGRDTAGRPLPGAANAAKRKAALAWMWGKVA